jgi:hypothetical protein
MRGHRKTAWRISVRNRWQAFTAETGDVVTAPGGSAHTFVNITAPARRFIQLLPGLDAVAFFIGLDKVMRDGRPDQEFLNAFGHDWHAEFLGPPLKIER